MEYLRDALSGKKLVLENDEIKAVKVPRLAEFKLKGILEQALADRLISKYLPTLNEKRGLNRRWLFTVSKLESLL